MQESALVGWSMVYFNRDQKVAVMDEMRTWMRYSQLENGGQAGGMDSEVMGYEVGVVYWKSDG